MGPIVLKSLNFNSAILTPQTINLVLLLVFSFTLTIKINKKNRKWLCASHIIIKIFNNFVYGDKKKVNKLLNPLMIGS